jgi:hypothetical protein
MHSMTKTACSKSAFGRGSRRWAAWPLLALLAACGTTEFEAKPVIPAPLITRIPVVIGVYIPAEFREKVHHEKRDGSEYAITLGAAQADGFTRLMGAMFTRAVPVPAADAGARTDPEIRGVLEPVLEDFAFITPSDSGAPLYAVSLKYRINGYTPTGQLFDSWTFTGYGTASSAGMPKQGKPALQQATALAMRDAGAKLATEFREQAIARGLLPAEAEPPPTEVVAPPQ